MMGLWFLRSELPKHESFTASDTQLLATVKAGEQVTTWERVETGVRDAAALTTTFTRRSGIEEAGATDFAVCLHMER
jgi:hypothetical protein